MSANGGGRGGNHTDDPSARRCRRRGNLRPPQHHAGDDASAQVHTASLYDYFHLRMCVRCAHFTVLQFCPRRARPILSVFERSPSAPSQSVRSENRGAVSKLPFHARAADTAGHSPEHATTATRPSDESGDGGVIAAGSHARAPPTTCEHATNDARSARAQSLACCCCTVVVVVYAAAATVIAAACTVSGQGEREGGSTALCASRATFDPTGVRTPFIPVPSG